MQEKVIVPELVLMRSVACLAVVLMHAIGIELQFNASLSAEATGWLTVVDTLLLFSTPAFAFMSAFLLGFSKREYRLGPVLWTRVKYLLAPFLFFALFYAAWGSYNWHVSFPERFVYNLRGGYHGYFVLIVMQFYVAHAVMERFLVRIRPSHAIVGTFAVNFFYLVGLNLKGASLPSIGFHWYHLFPAWLLYYVLGFYAGRHRETFQAVVRRRLAWVIALLVGSALVLLYLVLTGTMPDLSSQRFDVLPYATGVICIFFLLAGKIRRAPAVLNTISRFSFGIYLLHWFFIELCWRVASRFVEMPFASILGLWVASTAGSIAVTYVLSSLKVGPYLVGKLGVGYQQDAPVSGYGQVKVGNRGVNLSPEG